jgi:hypothetical protein
MKRAYGLVMVLVIFSMIGCGPRGIKYTVTVNDLKCSSIRSVAVAVLDERPYVLNKQKAPSYVGLMRGGYGNPFDLWTESGAPLAEDMLSTVADSLKARGIKVIPLKTSPTDSLNSVMTRLGESQAERLLLLEMKEWYSDYLPKAYTAESSTLFLNLELTVFDRNLKKIEKNNLQETLTLPSGWPNDTVPDVYQSKIRQLIDDARICQALQ